MLAFDGAIFSIEGWGDADWGRYEAHFGATLAWYPSYSIQTFTFVFEVAPNCARSTIFQFDSLSLPATNLPLILST